MGEPQDICERQKSPFINFQTPSTPIIGTTTTTTVPPEKDFFILPISGVSCPEPIGIDTNAPIYPTTPLDNPKIFYTCHSELYESNPCVIETDKYIKIADIIVDTDKCKGYRLELSCIPTSTTTTVAP